MKGNVDEVAAQVDEENKHQAAETAEKALSDQLATIAPEPATASPSVADLQKDIAAATDDVDVAANDVETPPEDTRSVSDKDLSYEPSIGGTLNATTEEAAEEKRREDESNRNHTILSHNSAPLGDEPDLLNTAPFRSFECSSCTEAVRRGYAVNDQDYPTCNHFHHHRLNRKLRLNPTPSEPQTLADLDKSHRAPHEEARAAVDAALSEQPEQPNPFGSALPPEPQQPASDPAHVGPFAPAPDAVAPQASTPQSSLPPLPDFSTLPPPPPQAPPTSAPFPAQAPEQLGQIFEAPAASTPPPPPNDPGQFKIPGQS